jgi:hypothetical protein
MGTIVSAIVDGVLKAAIGWLTAILEKRQLVKQGQTQQAAAETAKSEQTEASIAQAEADAPATNTAVLDRLKGGNA